MIRTGLDAVTEHLVVGAILAALVVLLFLGNARSTIIAAVAIPISIIGTFAMMKLAGFTLNFLTLLALALAVGIVIDDAIVVLENIFALHRREAPEAVHGGGARDARDRAGRPGDDAVAGRRVRPGRLRRRHDRAVLGQLRAHDGLRDHGVAWS
jgi:hypothetical protein